MRDTDDTFACSNVVTHNLSVIVNTCGSSFLLKRRQSPPLPYQTSAPRTAGISARPRRHWRRLSGPVEQNGTEMCGLFRPLGPFSVDDCLQLH